MIRTFLTWASLLRIDMASLIRKLHWQILIAFVPSVTLAFWLTCSSAGSDALRDIDKPIYITIVGGLASVVALFCSVSFGFVLFFLQSNRAERLNTYSELKNRLFA
jgi:hypothetical protein